MTASRTIKSLMFGSVAFTTLLALPAHAVFTINVSQNGSDVVITGSGSINTAGLSANGAGGCAATGYIIPSANVLCTGTTTGSETRYSGVTEPATPFGSGPSVFGNSSSGDGVSLIVNEIDLPSGYVSGAPLSSTATFTGQTIASLHLTPGTYIWTFGSGANADSVVLNIPGGAQPVPTLGKYAMIALASLLAMSGIAYTSQRRG